MSFFKDSATSHTAILRQLEVSKLTHELRQPTNLPQAQLAKRLSVAYATINRWEDQYTHPSPLTLKQLCVLVESLNQSSSGVLRSGSQQLLTQYFSQEGQSLL